MAVHEALNNVSQQVEYVGGRVGSVEANLDSTRSELMELRRVLDGYIKQSERSANVQRAETKVGNLKAQLQDEFGHYGHVRKVSIGTLQAFDIGNVATETVSKISEELMLQTPRYWLAPALLALAAWSRDDEGTCKISVAEAYKRDRNKTALFFALVLQRQNRLGEAYAWLETYLRTCNSTALTREFAVVLEASAQGIFGPQAANLVNETLTRWQEELRLNGGLVEAQATHWSAKVATNRFSLVESDVNALRELSPDFAKIKETVESASALQPMYSEFAKIRAADCDDANILDRLDDLLELLVTEYDEDELPLRRNVAYNNAVIDADGDLVEAKNRFNEVDCSLKETLDAVTLQTRIAVEPRSLGVSAVAQRNAVGIGIEDFRRGLANYCADYRSNYVDEVKLVLGPQHSSFSSAFGFTEFVTSTAEDEGQCFARLEEQWNTLFNPHIEKARFKPSQLARPIVLGAILTLLAFIIGPMLGTITGILSFGWCFWKYRSLNKIAIANVEQLQQTRQQAIYASCEKLTDARAQFTDLKYEYQDPDQAEQDLRGLIDSWPK